MIAGPGVVITSAQLSCAFPEQAGLFEDFDLDPRGNGEGNSTVLSGVVLGSTYADDCGSDDKEEAEDEEEDVGEEEAGRDLKDDRNGTGFELLDDVLPAARVTCNACVLHVEFICPEGYDRVEVQFVFGSNVYPSLGNATDEDAMGAFLNGQEPRHNVARAPGTSNQYVSVNTIFSGPEYVDNELGAVDIGLAGFTKPIESVGTINPDGASNFLEVAVADGSSQSARRDLRRRRKLAGTPATGAWVFLTASCLTCIQSTNTAISAGQTSVRTCAHLAAVGTGCQCSWTCILREIKRRCVFTGSVTAFQTYVSQVRTNIKTRFCPQL
jgi:hypothetical protein